MKNQQQSDKIGVKVLADDEFYENEAEIEISILRVELELITPELEIRYETQITLSEKLFKIQARAIGGELLTPEGIEFGFTALPTLSTLKIREKLEFSERVTADAVAQ